MSHNKAQFPLTPDQIDHFVTGALDEDLGAGGDITSLTVIPDNSRLTVAMTTREDVVLAGLDLACAFFSKLDPDCTIEQHHSDGDLCPRDQRIVSFSGDAHALLAAERPALNILQHLSGVATLTRRYVQAIEGTKAVLLDTRKTLPGYRLLQKYATRTGGAKNHRMRLDSAILIKDNHIAIAGSITTAIKRAKNSKSGPVEVECDSLSQVREALDAGADRLLLDNMDCKTLREAVALVSGRVPTEASGGVTLDSIADIARTGVDYISVGRLTQSAPAIDIGLDICD